MTEASLSRGAFISRVVRAKINYWRRIVPAYFGGGVSQLTFWHDHPAINDRAFNGGLAEYYQDFSQKADYPGPYDSEGVPLLDYRGKIGRQHNPIAIAQYGLGNYNLYRQTEQVERRRKFLKAADWLTEHLESNRYGVPVWHHHFDWEHREILKAPWYSALAQGQGISLLVRAFADTGRQTYLDAAHSAFKAFLAEVSDGGVRYRDENGDIWFEEYLVSPPSHILNGFIWALWGVYDYYLSTQQEAAKRLFQDGISTLTANLWRYDTRYWSLYDLNTTRLLPLASPFYHRLHIIQLDGLHRLTGKNVFFEYGRLWEGYRRSFLKRKRALACKALFKIFYY